MATITPTDVSYNGYRVITWTGVSTADTMVSQAMVVPRGTVAASRGFLTISGTFGSSTVKLRGSNDNSTFFDIKDSTGTTISATAATAFEVLTSAPYLTVSSSGGTADNVDVVLTVLGV